MTRLRTHSGLADKHHRFLLLPVLFFAAVLIGGWNICLGEVATNLLSPTEAASRVRVPPGFKVTLFAGEPDVRQPIAMAFDDRGRLWVAECYTYSDSKTNFDLGLHDRILIFEDSKGTGHFDKRKVFWDKGTHLTSIAPGFGGVYALCAPNLIFIPDRNGDDVPDGPPETVLDGWDDNKVRHNIVNGLKWGPDGWLYGRHGIMATSSVGKPGAAQAERTQINCGIWRYHPGRKTFEVFCQGTTNPWGHDWDEHGQLFFINTVIGHLWEGIPGAYYKRMYGEPLQPYRYGLIDQAADHYHWDTGKTWQASRDASASSESLGGGHAHTGLMIYQGLNWPEEYQGGMFTLNFHGRRINHDRLDPFDSGPIGKHEPDMVQFEDPWFRGLDLDYGPDGAVYVLDWSDTGECHGTDSVNRDSGRIFRITWEGTNARAVAANGRYAPACLLTNSLLSANDSELAALQSQPNEWLVRHSRRLLQERAETGALTAKFRNTLARRFEEATTPPEKLRLLFALHVIDADTLEWLLTQLHQQDIFLRAWAVRFLAEAAPHDKKVLAAFERLALNDPSPVVRLELASALQRLALPDREPIGMALLQHGSDSQDRYLPSMIWDGIEPFVESFPTNAINLAVESKIPSVRGYVARRIGDLSSRKPGTVSALLARTLDADSKGQMDILRGLIQALGTAAKVSMPTGWESFRKQIARSEDKDLVNLIRQLGAIFADPWAMESLENAARETRNSAGERRAAVQQLIKANPVGLQNILHALMDDPITAGVAARGLLLQNDTNAPGEVLRHWKQFDAEDGHAVVGLLTTRASFATVLLDNMASGAIPKNAMDASQARQIFQFQDDALGKKLTSTWGEVRTSNAEKLQTIARYREVLNPKALNQADLSHGRAVFNQMCSVCHKLYGEGNSIGPELTGGGRASLDYLLENVVDPNAIVPGGYRVTQFELKDDRSVGGLILERSEGAFTVQTSSQKMVILRSEIDSMRETTVSLMPEGLLQSLKEEQARDLIAYLMAPKQVPLRP